MWLSVFAPSHKSSLRRRLNMNSITLSEKDIERFWKKVKIGEPDECWEWQACRFRPGGYGGFQLCRKVFIGAHRISWIIKNGNIPKNMCVCHKCDNRLCVNPNHLFLGTSRENNQDMANKGRSYKPNGEKNYFSKLKEKDVVEIRRMIKDKIKTREIARKFSVTPTTISNINAKRTWSYLE